MRSFPDGALKGPFFDAPGGGGEAQVPGDETYVHLIDALSASGPQWLLVVGVLALATIITIKALPLMRDVKAGELEINRQREQRKAEETRLRDERDREHSVNTARMVDAVNRQSDASRAMAAALDAMTMRLDSSKERSAHMGEQVDEMAQQVDEIHAATVRRAK